MFSLKFISASREYSTFEKYVPAPYLRRSFTLEKKAEKATITVCGLGFYELYVNGERITKGYLAPYISNPDDILYYDSYDIADKLKPGKNTLAILLGNGLLNCTGGTVWDFHLARWRSAPKAALSFEAELEDGTALAFEADERFVCAPSPIYFDDFRIGEFYDARNEIPGWNLPEFDDSAWTPAISVEAPRGECRLCEAEPIVITRTVHPVEIRRAGMGVPVSLNKKIVGLDFAEKDDDPREGWLYDFGVNAAGLCRLKIRGEAGQKVILRFSEALDKEGNLEMRGISYYTDAYNHRDVYICRGGEEEIWMPAFTYHGFRYCLVLGITEEQATPDLLTYAVMNSDLREAGDFSCSDEVLNKLQAATRVSDLANFYYFPTDCPHREKNGWTADAALSAEHMLVNLTPEKSYREWLHNIRKAQREDGALPGIIPTGGWGFAWGNGPAWDCVAVYLPYFVWKYRGDKAIIRENAAMLMRYLHYITTRRDEDGLMHIGLGDWCQTAAHNVVTAPLKVTDTIMCMDICHKAAVCFGAVGMNAQKAFADALYAEFREAARAHLIDYGTMTVLGNCQCSQAMAIYYNVFEEAEKEQAFRVLVSLIEENDGLMDVGVLGARVMFRVLSQFGRTDLAYRMVTDGRCPSYAQWIHEGATALYEDFHPSDAVPWSLNHHFWGDISAWMIEMLAGIVVNPGDTSPENIRIQPHFIEALSHASAYHTVPAGKIESSWKRDGDAILLTVSIPEGCRGDIRLDKEWMFERGEGVKDAVSGTYRLIRRKK